MIPNHDQFIKAIHERKKVCVRFFSHADNGVLDRVCAPVDYGPDTNSAEGLNRYQLWNFIGEPGSQMLTFVPQQVIDLRILGESFDASAIPAGPTPWTIARDWSSAAPTDPKTSLAAPATVSAIGISAPSRTTTAAPALATTSSP